MCERLSRCRKDLSAAIHRALEEPPTTTLLLHSPSSPIACVDDTWGHDTVSAAFLPTLHDCENLSPPDLTQDLLDIIDGTSSTVMAEIAQSFNWSTNILNLSLGETTLSEDGITELNDLTEPAPCDITKPDDLTEPAPCDIKPDDLTEPAPCDTTTPDDLTEPAPCDIAKPDDIMKATPCDITDPNDLTKPAPCGMSDHIIEPTNDNQIIEMVLDLEDEYGVLGRANVS
ncbi:uncharacterized protein ACNLHF_026879 [Anomaloglossus baeobatrachus]|uniref:uncharacterized protein LOC142249208 n=1 Tax=Anomaloglossus baeobatrachus TaxID=238106 RepID=UPI003F501AD0